MKLLKKIWNAVFLTAWVVLTYIFLEILHIEQIVFILCFSNCFARLYKGFWINMGLIDE